jgi:hypothetical protein
MLSYEFQIEMLKNIKYQNKLLLKQYENIINNEIVMKDILIKINNTYNTININNIILVSIFIAQIFILFK